MGSKRTRRLDRLRSGRPQQAAAVGLDWLPRIEWAAALVVTGSAVILTLTCLHAAGALWRDEANSVNLVTLPSLAETWRHMEFESFPLLWLLLLKGWIATGLGSTDTGLRAFGALGGLTIPAAVWFAARRLGGAVPLVSAALLAINPDIVRWAVTVRAWGLGVALAIVALVLVREASAAPTPRRVAVATCAAVLSVQCVFQNAVLLAAVVAGAAAVACTRRDWGRVVVPVGIGAVAAISLLPYAGVIARVSRWSMLNQEPVTLGHLAATLLAVVASSGMPVLVCWLIAVALALGAAVRTVSGPAPGRGASHDVTLYAAVVMVVAVGGLLLFYARFRYPTQAWYYLGLVAIVAVCAEAAIVAFSSARAIRIALVALALVIVMAGAPFAWALLGERLTNVDEAAARLNAEVKRGDLVIVSPWHLAISFRRYYRGDADVTTLPPLDDHAVHRFDLVKAQMLSTDPLGPLLARIRRALESGHRVWIVGGLEVLPPGTAVPRLAPPPLPDSGWNARPYLQAWSLQTGAWLRDHATSGTDIPMRVAGGRYEAAQLTVVSGWRP